MTKPNTVAQSMDVLTLSEGHTPAPAACAEKKYSVVGMWSPYGGTGTTGLVMREAQSLAGKGQRVGLIDFNPNLGLTSRFMRYYGHDFSKFYDYVSSNERRESTGVNQEHARTINEATSCHPIMGLKNALGQWKDLGFSTRPLKSGGLLQFLPGDPFNDSLIYYYYIELNRNEARHSKEWCEMFQDKTILIPKILDLFALRYNLDVIYVDLPSGNSPHTTLEAYLRAVDHLVVVLSLERDMRLAPRQLDHVLGKHYGLTREGRYWPPSYTKLRHVHFCFVEWTKTTRVARPPRRTELDALMLHFGPVFNKYPKLFDVRSHEPLYIIRYSDDIQIQFQLVDGSSGLVDFCVYGLDGDHQFDVAKETEFVNKTPGSGVEGHAAEATDLKDM